MNNSISLSILDQSPIRRGNTAGQALNETIELARQADQWGYTRFWVSEHHNTQTLAGSSPEVLIARLANETKNLKLGSGGVMLPNHSTLKVAESFRTLEALYPGRIDLGIGRAPGGDRITASLLNPSNTFNEKDFVQQLVDLQHYLGIENEYPKQHSRVHAIPMADTAPDLWILSSSGQSGLFAAHLGMALSFAHFINPNGGPQSASHYRQRFRPSAQLKEPKVTVGVFVLCAETEEKALELQKVMDVLMLNMEKGKSEGIPCYEEIKNYKFTFDEQDRVRFNRKRMVFGTPAQVKQQLESMAAAYGTDELIAVTITEKFEDRLRSYELLAKEFNLIP